MLGECIVKAFRPFAILRVICHGLDEHGQGRAQNALYLFRRGVGFFTDRLKGGGGHDIIQIHAVFPYPFYNRCATHILWQHT